MSILSKLLYCSIITTGGIVENKFNRETKNAENVNKEILLKILKRNAKSEIGIKYDFQNVKSIEDYIRQVPLSNYLDYENYIDRMANGEKNILVSEEVEYFGHTSGTTGKQKLIPVTKSGRMAASKYMAILSQRFVYNNFRESFKYGKGLMFADTVTTTYTKSGIPICSATSGGMKKIKGLIPYMYTSPYEVMEVKDKEAQMYLHLLFALKERKLSYITSVFISNVLDLLRFLEEKIDLLVMDIRKGRINKSLNIDDITREKLKKYIKPDAARADKIDIERKRGFKGICKRIWPEITYIACVAGANFSIYDERVNYYTGNLPIYSTAYAATEATMGINPYIDKIRYVIIPDTVFYEFISVKDENKEIDKTYRLNELKLGEKYEIVITNQAGLYRYKLGDVIKVVGNYNNCPEIEFLYRKNQVLNMVSEKTTEEHLTISIQNTVKKLNLSLVDYTTIEDTTISPGRYIFYFEFKDDISRRNMIEFENVLDKELQRANLAYGRFRNNNRLAKVKVKVVNGGTFNIIKESLIKKGISKNQIKMPRVINDKKEILKILMSKTI
ncbi:GH3 auxin-responsive promoter family protein [Clostridium sp. NSJ-49]|uniref:Plant auxin-responsive GH3-like protein n=1 Tax=Clostridium disporicum TaxID=84024 RepID=A0A174DXP1_9CLOT|nr:MULTISPECIES: GH3 auxin-responsive promoter family protein [Clostridium]MBC5626380.1 GH3 auxin-responsive promoter family protein [Clostridium sp. NSJ-49]MCD2500386.1 GH3 auxin-responsive promoter family protein [Clostridium sp. NSJ-145]MDU6340854.1 GH3 auxin-responsive promoter family protein [Clostridium sp.]CUO30273.1 plant auxin-responsive GH3-like protein [Clostridium disporicum]